MKIEILGPGCARCQQLAKNAEEAAKALGIPYELVKVTDMAKIVGYGVMATPGIVVDGKLKGSGKLFTVDEIKGFLAG
jgi:small redox-active disulfide protein 2